MKAALIHVTLGLYMPIGRLAL